MKKLALLFVSIYLGTALFYGQTGQTAEGLLKAKTKSDEEIQDPKKNIKPGTWEKRGDLFLEMAQFNTKNLYVGMQKKGITGAELLVGKPKSIKANGNNEEWIYDRITLQFVGDALDNWEETSPLEAQALEKSLQAFKKADSLDVKGKFKSKSNIKASSMTLRNAFISEAADLYSKKKYAEAVAKFEKVIELGEWPKATSDTSYKAGLIIYYTALAAYNAKSYAAAEKYYQLCIDKNLEGGMPYNGLAEVYKATGEATKEYDILQKGFAKFPESKELLVGFINYYLGSGQSDKALEKLEQAIKDDPKNPTFVFAKASLFDNIVAKDTLNKLSPEAKKGYFDKAVESYKNAIAINPNYFEANYNLGALYYNEAVFKIKEADRYPVKEKEKFETKNAEAKLDVEKSLPYLEKAHELDALDRSTVQTLITIYHRLQLYDKKKAMQEKLDNLPKGGL